MTSHVTSPGRWPKPGVRGYDRRRAPPGPDARAPADPGGIGPRRSGGVLRRGRERLRPNTAGSVGSGRREINWDGVPDAFSSPNALPANFFNVNSPRGVVFSTPGTGFLVSRTAAQGNPRFDDVRPGYSTTFGVFSAQRLFSPSGSTFTDVTLFVPGSATAATSKGFGEAAALRRRWHADLRRRCPRVGGKRRAVLPGRLRG